MTTGATGQLGLALPVQGELSGTWGDTVNNGITQYTNIAIAGTLTLTGDGAVTLANTTGDASASNITSTLTGAGTVTAQFAIVKVTGTLTTAKVVTGPSYSKTYTVVNSATGGIVTFKASGQTGVSVAVGESAFVYFNGTDYVKLVGTATAGAAGGSNTQVQYNNSGVLAGITGATTNGTALTLVAPNLGSPASVGTMPAFTLGGTVSGGGNQINNVIIGTSTPLAGTFTQIDITAQGTLRLQDTTGGEYVALRAPASLAGNYTLTFPADDGTSGQALITDGSGVLSWSTAASGDVYGPASATANGIALFDGTTGKLLKDSAATDGLIYGLTVGRGAGAVFNNTAVGVSALASNTTGNSNTAIGIEALRTNTLGSNNTANGLYAMYYNLGGSSNTANGASALQNNTSGSFNTASGMDALKANLTAVNNVGIGYQAGYLNQAISNQTFVGYQSGYNRATNNDNYSTVMIGFQAGYATSTGIDNTYVGGYAGKFQTGSTNTALGSGALYGVSGSSTASGNTVVGYQSGVAITTGSDNTAFGYVAGKTITTGVYNIVVGPNSMDNSAGITGSDNVAIGRISMRILTSGNYNVSLGNGALNAIVSGSSNVAIGYQSLAVSTASNNVAVGYQAGASNTSGSANVFIGLQSALYNLTGSSNTSLGYGAFSSGNGSANGTGSNNVALGRAALSLNTTADNNTAVGAYAGYSTNSGTQNVFIGGSSGYYNQTGIENTYVGYSANGNGSGGTASAGNTGVGRAVLNNNYGNYNTALGNGALQNNSSASTNTAVGYQAGYSNVSGTGLDVFGYEAGYYVTASYNTFFGSGAGKGVLNSSVGEYNVGIGRAALAVFTTGERNTAVGVAALATHSSGLYNTAVGMYALAANLSASSNTAVGYSAGITNQTGASNVYVGTQAGRDATANSNVFVGKDAGLTVSSGGGNTYVGYGSGPNSVAGTGIQNTTLGYLSGNAITTGSKNTILGGYNGNQGGLDIRTASNYIVLSDGDGNPRGVFNSSGGFAVTATNGGTAYSLDTTSGGVSVANNGTVDFLSMSGMIIVTNWTSGSTTVYITGGGSVTVIANTSGQVGTLAYYAAGDGYRWTNTYGSTAYFGFVNFRTRLNA